MAARTVRGAALCALLAITGSAAAGDIYVCKGAHGVKSYQNVPCAQVSDQVGHNTYSNAMARPAQPPSYTVQQYSAPAPRPVSRAARPQLVTAGSATAYRGGGIGSTAYQRGEAGGRRCVSAKGQVYFAAECGSSVTYAGMRARDWRGDRVEGVPGAVMTQPNGAIDPMTGQFVQLIPEPMDEPAYVRTQDAGTDVSADEACAGARRAAAGRFSKKADDRVQDLCRFGRSMYDQPRSGRP